LRKGVGNGVGRTWGRTAIDLLGGGIPGKRKIKKGSGLSASRSIREEKEGNLMRGYEQEIKREKKL